MKHDVVIVGGGAIGLAIAYYLRTHQRSAEVCVVEKDSSYQYASTPLASGGARRLFSTPENIQMSNYSIDRFANFDDEMKVDDDAFSIAWQQQGYLFIMPHRAIRILTENIKVQEEHGVNVEFLDQKALKERFPSMKTDDLGGAAYSPDDGWLDPSSLLQGYRKKCVALGVAYQKGEVVSIDHDDHTAKAVVLADGQRIEADVIVNATGAWAKDISVMVGQSVPIEPMKRYEHQWETRASIEPLPYVKDLDRLAFRPEGIGYSGGVPSTNQPRGIDFDVDYDYFDRVVWPALAYRFPAFEEIKHRNSWAGLYDQNEFDGNPVIGPWTGKMDNFITAAGFSGHGLMHAPATGRAVAELILDGGYQTIDLTRLGFDRFAEMRPVAEEGIV
ncbi:MAG: NAD(P)/FAD-dependent oxidoreductase [Methyloligellaceae bacterium]